MWQFDPTAWVNGVTKPSVSDFQAIKTDLRTSGGTRDGGGYGVANTSYMILLPGALPGTQYTVTNATWSAGVATLTIGGHSVSVGQRMSASGITWSGYNTPLDSVAVTAVTSTTISFQLGSNPGSTGATGGLVLVDGVSPAWGMVAIDPNLHVQVWNGSAWVAAVSAAPAPHWLRASGAPSGATGTDGDMYLDSSTGDVYGPKASGLWGSAALNMKGPTGSQGPQGIQGVVGPGYLATSTTSLTIGTGTYTFGTQTGLAYVAGGRVRAASNANPNTNWMEGVVVSYTGSTLVVNVQFSGGSGTYTDWNLSVAGMQGIQGNTGAGYAATSSSSFTIGTGSKAFVTQTGLAYSAGARVRLSSAANTANYMEGTVTSYSGATLTVNVDAVGGSGSHADWNVNVTGLQGAQGPQGLPGTGSFTAGAQTITSNTTIAATYTELYLEVDCSAGNVTATLFTPAAGNTNYKVIVKRFDTTPNAAASAIIGATVDGQVNPPISKNGDSLIVYSNGSAFRFC